MKLNFTGDISELKTGIDLLSSRLGFIADETGVSVCVRKADGLAVNREGDSFVIEYSATAEFFRALSVLLYNIQNAALNIQERRHFDNCGIMIDVSRNAVPTVSTVKDIIERLALMGIDSLMLYTEDVYKMEKYPYFGYMRGAYTKEELREIDNYGQTFGIEVIPCIQTLGHLERALRWAEFSGVKDNARVLLVDEPKTYEFIEEMFKTMRETFTSRKIHIGMDEAHGLGFGKFYKKYGFENPTAIMKRHLDRVVEIAKKYDFEPTMWGDMFFRMNSKADNLEAEYYDDSVVFDDFTKNLVPKEVTIAYWDYYNTDSDFCGRLIEKHKELSENVAFYGGVWTWSGVSINYAQTLANTHSALSESRKRGIKQAFATLWGDDGAETNVYAALLGIQLFAEYNYYENVSDEHLNKMFKICTGYDAEAFVALDCDRFPEPAPLRNSASKQVLYQDILLGLFDKNFEDIDIKGHYGRCLEMLKAIEKQGDLEYLFDYQRQLVKVLELKSDIGIRLVKAYKSDDKTQLTDISKEIFTLIGEMEALHEKLAEVWYKNNKPFGFNALDVRFGGVIARLKRANIRIEDYVSGEISVIEELDEPRLLYNGTLGFAGDCIGFDSIMHV